MTALSILDLAFVPEGERESSALDTLPVGADKRHLVANGLMSVFEKIWEDAGTAPGNSVVRLRAARVRRSDGAVTSSIDIRRPVSIDSQQPGRT